MGKEYFIKFLFNVKYLYLTTMNKRSFKDYILISLKGVGMGAADVVPGVSGGTIAFITGIYEELLLSIKLINLEHLSLLLKGEVKTFWQKINGNFLLSIAVGIAFSLLTLAKLMSFLLESYPIMVWSFFFGLIIASAIYVGKGIKRWNASTLIFLILGAAVAYFISSISPVEANTSYWFVFLSGVIAICAMILPGISGSFILLLLGMYKYIMNALSDFNVLVIACFAMGAGIGIISFSNILSWLLKKYYNQTIALLAGFMIGSLNKIWPWKEVVETFVNRHGEVKPLIEHNISPFNYPEPQLLWAIVFALGGFMLIFMVEGMANYLATKKEANKSE